MKNLKGRPRLAEKRKIFTELWMRGVTGTEIAKLLGVSTVTIYAWRKELGLPRNERGRRYGTKIVEGKAVYPIEAR